jgi:hypothetical protein
VVGFGVNLEKNDSILRACGRIDSQRSRAMRGGLLVFLVSILMSPAFAPCSSAQASKDIVGSWGFLVNETTRADGTKFDTYGAKPKGILMFDSNGHFSLFIANVDRPRFASGSRLDGTPSEYKAAVEGSISYFGRYTVDEAAKAINFELEASSFPNWDGVSQKRPFSISGDELRFTNSSGSSGGSVLVVLKRLN